VDVAWVPDPHGTESPMDVFTPAELNYLRSAEGLARIATVGPDGIPHVTPVGWSVSADQRAIEVGGKNLSATKKFRDIARTGHAALVIDEVLPPWQPQGIEVRGHADAITDPRPLIRLHPRRIHSWGFEGASGTRTIAGAETATPDSAGTSAQQRYAVVRKTHYDPERLGDGAALAEFQVIHAAQPGYEGSVLVDAGEGIRIAVTIWESQQHAAAARSALEPTIRQLLNPMMTEPAQLVALGPLVAGDLLLDRTGGGSA
jgi:pyridoxamine 5'-phosphate oxidase family protein